MTPHDGGRLCEGATARSLVTAPHSLSVQLEQLQRIDPGDTPLVLYEESRSVVESEAERLAQMAALKADEISFDAILEEYQTLPVGTPYIVDVGCGDSTSLGESLRGGWYIPTDIREDAVARHRRVGFGDAAVGSATQLPYEDGIGDILHSRFTFGWLQPPERTTALKEMLRVGGDEMGVVVIDYDWSALEGPDSLKQLAKVATGILRAGGFDPDYGRKLYVDVGTRLGRLIKGFDPASELSLRRESSYEGDFRSAVDLIKVTVQSLIDQLAKQGLYDQVALLNNLVAGVMADVEQNPDVQVKLPDVVAVRCRVSKSRVLPTEEQIRVDGVNEEQERARFKYVEPRELGVVALRAPELIKEARRAQASAYLAHNHVTEEALAPDGTLIAEVDPPELRARSTYYALFNETDEIGATIRAIHPTEDGLRSLPTIEKILLAPRGREIIEASEFARPGVSVFEASGLGKLSKLRDPHALTKLIMSLAVAPETVDYEYAIMGVVEETSRILVSSYGTNAFRRIDGSDAILSMDGCGLREGGVTLVPFFVRTKSFIESVIRHARVRNLARRTPNPHLLEMERIALVAKRHMEEAQLKPGLA